MARGVAGVSKLFHVSSLEVVFCVESCRGRALPKERAVCVLSTWCFSSCNEKSCVFFFLSSSSCRRACCWLLPFLVCCFLVERQKGRLLAYFSGFLSSGISFRGLAVFQPILARFLRCCALKIWSSCFQKELRECFKQAGSSNERIALFDFFLLNVCLIQGASLSLFQKGIYSTGSSNGIQLGSSIRVWPVAFVECSSWFWKFS
jgi:hypothetical protein